MTVVANFRWARPRKRDLQTELGGRVKKLMSFSILGDALMELKVNALFPKSTSVHVTGWERFLS